jgi:Flp pilus assembly pilin Flp
MKNLLLKFYLAARGLIRRDDAQDLVEYGLVVTLIALICIAGMNTFATAVNSIFIRIDKHLF